MKPPLVSLFACALAVVACSSDSDSSSGAACPQVYGTWKVTKHCDASLVGMDSVVTQSGCSLTFGVPFSGFTGTVAADGKVTISGPQSCTGTASQGAMALSCTPGTCEVALSR